MLTDIIKLKNFLVNLDTANRLPANLKRRYLDKLDKSLLDLNQPSFEGFELLRKFVEHEIKGGESSSQFQWFTIAKIEL